MDVRCEKCGTEYELDESRLKPTGVTVKCTSCGHLFKVRKRGATMVGVPASSPVPAGKRGPQTPSGPAYSRAKTSTGPVPRAEARRAQAASTPPPGAAGDNNARGRRWLIRMPTGEIEMCRELATLQQWIASGKVSRTSGISRTGKSWKRLGDIPELASFFAIADKARKARLANAIPLPEADEDEAPTRIHEPWKAVVEPSMDGTGDKTERMTPGGMAPEPRTPKPFAPEPRTPAPLGPQAGLAPEPRTPAPLGPQAGLAPEPRTPAPKPLGPPAEFGVFAPEPRTPAPKPLEPAAEFGVFAPEPRTPAPKPLGPAAEFGVFAPEPRTPAPKPLGPAAGLAPEPRTPMAHGAEVEHWAGKVRKLDNDSGPAGPIGGMARGVPMADVAFARSKLVAPDRIGDPGHDGAAEDDGADEPAKSSVGRWLVLFSLVLMAGAAVAVYMLVFRNTNSDAVVTAEADAGEAVVSPPVAARVDAAPPVPEKPVTDERAELLAMAQAQRWAGDVDGLESTAQELAGLAEDDIEVLVARALVATALAQNDLDQARFAGDKSDDAKKLEEAAQKRLLAALPLVQKALKLKRNHGGANLAMADVLRLQGRRTRMVQSYLDAGLRQNAKDRDGRLVQALLYVEGKKERQARQLLQELAGGMQESGDVRPAYRLAIMDVTGDATGDAAGQKLGEAQARVAEVLAAKPDHQGAKALKKYLDEAGADASAPPDPPDKGPETRPDKNDDNSYEGLVARARRKQESGSCRDAVPLYERAVDMNPIGLEALVGLGYCHIERKEFASAHAKFKAALVVSSRYQDALWGIAEAYQQQGLKDRAIEAYQKFIEEHPQGSRAAMAKRQIEKLGGGASAPGSGSPGSESPGSESPDKPGNDSTGADKPGSGETGPGADSTDKGGQDEAKPDAPDSEQ